MASTRSDQAERRSARASASDPPDANAEAATADRQDADPEHPDKPDGPTEITKPNWKFILRKTIREFSDDECLDLAAALTYYAVLALFPALLAIVSMLSLFGQEDTTASLVGIAENLGGESIASTVQGPLQELINSQAAGFTLVLGLAGALWSASGYIGAFGRAMNRIYEIDEGRPFWKLRPLLLVITLVAVVLVALVAVGLVISGPVAQAVGDAIGLGETAVTVWNIAKWPVLAAIAALVVAILYYATPNVKQPKFRWISLGAGVAIVTWVLASVAFGFYVSNFSNYNKTYGSLAGVIVFLLWLWITNLALLFGAELDAEMERGRQLQAGLPAEEEIQLPARDTRTIDKNAAKDAADVERARALRTSRGASDDEPATRGNSA